MQDQNKSGIRYSCIMTYQNCVRHNPEIIKRVEMEYKDAIRMKFLQIEKDLHRSGLTMKSLEPPILYEIGYLGQHVGFICLDCMHIYWKSTDFSMKMMQNPHLNTYRQIGPEGPDHLYLKRHGNTWGMCPHFRDYYPSSADINKKALTLMGIPDDDRFA